MKLLCLPYAGSSAYNYLNWSRYFDESIEIIPIELKGRGGRYKEKHYNNFQEAVKDVFCLVKKSIDKDNEYAIFGHSMGGLLAYEVCMILNEDNIKPPRNLILSGVTPPHIKERLIPTDDLEKIIDTFCVVPQDILNNPELRNIFIPILEADCNIVDLYQFDESREKLEIDIDIFFGTEDKTTPFNLIKKWSDLTSRVCKLHSFTGEHFFINEDIRKVVDKIQSILSS